MLLGPLEIPGAGPMGVVASGGGFGISRYCGGSSHTQAMFYILRTIKIFQNLALVELDACCWCIYHVVS